MVRTNYLLLDYENVQPKNLDVLKGTPFKVLVFVGANQTKVSMEFAQSLQALGSQGEYIQISGSGPNALDFHIAFTIGELSQADPHGYFHVISKDKGFDPLIAYAKKKGIRILRSLAINDVPCLKLSSAKTHAEKIDGVVQNLMQRSQARPRKVKTLTSTINALFQKSLTDAELADLIKALAKQGHIAIDGESITYHLPAAKAT